MLRSVFLAAMLVTGMAHAQSIAPREGWQIHSSAKSYKAAIDAVKGAVKANKMGLVTQAGPTGMAARRGITIPGNRVLGVFNNVYAVRILGLSTAAMIEAPIRIYVTQEPDGTALISYKTPSHVFAPYMAEGGDDLALAAGELDVIFAKIVSDALK